MHSCLCKGVGSSVALHLLSRQHLQWYIPSVTVTVSHLVHTGQWVYTLGTHSKPLSYCVYPHLTATFTLGITPPWRVMNVTITTTFTLGISITPPYSYYHTGFTLGTHWVPLYKLWVWDPGQPGSHYHYLCKWSCKVQSSHSHAKKIKIFTIKYRRGRGVSLAAFSQFFYVFPK